MASVKKIFFYVFLPVALSMLIYSTLPAEKFITYYNVNFTMLGSYYLSYILRPVFRFFFNVPNEAIDGNVTIEGLHGPVKIYRDKLGIPYINATCDEDMLFAQGYITAIERSAQMHSMILHTEGRLSEFFGPKFINLDIYMRTIGIPSISQKSYNESSDILKKILYHYTQGITQGFKSSNKHQFEHLNLPFNSTWTEIQTISIMLLLSTQLNRGWDGEIGKLVLKQQLDEKQLAELFPQIEQLVPYINPEGTKAALYDQQGNRLEAPNVKTAQLIDTYKMFTQELFDSSQHNILNKTHINTHNNIQTNIQTNPHTNTHKNTHANIDTYTPTNTHTSTHTNTHKNTQNTTDSNTEHGIPRNTPDSKDKNHTSNKHTTRHNDKKNKTNNNTHNNTHNTENSNNIEDTSNNRPYESTKSPATNTQNTTQTNTQKGKQIIQNDPQTTQNSTQIAQSNTQTTQNKTQITQNNTQSTQNKTQTTQNNTQTAHNNTHTTQSNTHATNNNTQSTQNNTQNNLEDSKEYYEGGPFQSFMEIDGSNAWAISGNYTKSKKPLIAGDMHLMNTAPGTFFPIFMFSQNSTIFRNSTESVRMIGASVPGVPGIIAGHNEYIGLSMTVSYVDTEDLFAVQLNENGTSYIYDGQEIPLNITEEVLHVKGYDQPISARIKYTHHGPLLTNIINKERANLGPNQAIAFSTPLHRTNVGFNAIMTFGVTNWKSLLENLAYNNCIQLVATWGDVEGNIGNFVIGNIPVREASNYVRNGTSSESDWKRFYDITEVPHYMNPPRGYTFAANSILGRDEEKAFGEVYVPGHRQRRISSILEGYVSNSKCSMCEKACNYEGGCTEGNTNNEEEENMGKLGEEVEKNVEKMGGNDTKMEKNDEKNVQKMEKNDKKIEKSVENREENQEGVESTEIPTNSVKQVEKNYTKMKYIHNFENFNKLDVKDFQIMQTDQFSYNSCDWKFIILNVFKHYNIQPTNKHTYTHTCTCTNKYLDDNLFYTIIQQAKLWNCGTSRQHKYAPFFETWLHLSIHVFLERAGIPEKAKNELLGSIPNSNFLHEIGVHMRCTMIRLLKDENSTVIQQAGGATAILCESLSQLLELSKRFYGKPTLLLRWEDIQSLYFLSQTSMAIPFLIHSASVGPFSPGGNFGTIHVSRVSTNKILYDGSHQDVKPSVGPATRIVMDAGDWSSSRWLTLPGASGWVGSPHFGDQLEYLKKGELYPMLWKDEDIKKAAVTTLNMSPKK